MATDVMQAEVILKYNGTDATKTISGMMKSFSFTDNANGNADSISLELSNRSGKWFKGYYPEQGDWIKAWIKVTDWSVGKKEKKLYLGRFAIDTIRFSGFGQNVSIEGISIPLKNGFNTTQRNRTWKKTNLKTMLGDIADDAGIKLVYDAGKHKIKEESQSGQTDMEFAYSMCSEFGLSMKLFDNKLVAYNQTSYEKADALFEIGRDDLSSFDFDVSVLKDYDSIKAQYSDGDDTSTFSFVRPNKKGKRRMFLSTKCDSVGEAETKAKAALREQLRSNQTVSFETMGDLRFVAGTNIKLTGFGELNGKYFIDTVTHTIEGKFTTSVTAHKTVTDF